MYLYYITVLLHTKFPLTSFSVIQNIIHKIRKILFHLGLNIQWISHMYQVQNYVDITIIPECNTTDIALQYVMCPSILKGFRNIRRVKKCDDILLF